MNIAYIIGIITILTMYVFLISLLIYNSKDKDVKVTEYEYKEFLDFINKTTNKDKKEDNE